MYKTYQQEFILRTCDCDFMGQWRPSAIMQTMQELAGMHSELLGCGRNALIEKNVVWVLTRCEIHMDRYPKIGDHITAETFPTVNRRWFFPRYYFFRDERGESLGYAATLWVLMRPAPAHGPARHGGHGERRGKRDAPGTHVL